MDEAGSGPGPVNDSGDVPTGNRAGGPDGGEAAGPTRRTALAAIPAVTTVVLALISIGVFGFEWRLLADVPAGFAGSSDTLAVAPIDVLARLVLLGSAIGARRRLRAISHRAAAIVALGGLAWLLAPWAPVARGGLLAGMVASIGLLIVLMRGGGRDLSARDSRLPRVASMVAASMAAGAVAVGLGILAASPAPVTECGTDGAWTCRVVIVPVDHATTSPRPEVLRVTYAIYHSEGAGPARGTLLIAEGGPGGSGLGASFRYATWVSPEIRATFDLVVFDARGVGASDGRDCPTASEDYRRFYGQPVAAERYAAACVDEATGGRIDLRRYATAQTIEDMEAIRESLGRDRLAVYGFSYGTVPAQGYAAAHPDRVTALVLDAPFDRSLSGIDTLKEEAQGFEASLTLVLEACRSDPACRSDLPDPRPALDRLLARAESGGVAGTYRPGDGSEVKIRIGEEPLRDVVTTSLYEKPARTLLLRAMAAAEGGDDGPIVRLWAALQRPTPGERKSDFAYLATWCADMRVSPTGRTDDADALLAAGRAAGLDTWLASRAFRTLLPCLYWPAQPATFIPPPDPVGVPTLLLTSTADPVTPSVLAHRIRERIPGAALVETDGGSHGSRWEDCPAGHVVAFLLRGELPGAPVTACPGSALDRYVPLSRDTSDGAMALVRLTLAELEASPEMHLGSTMSFERAACADGGLIEFSWFGRQGPTVTLRNCAWKPGVPVDGEGVFDPRTGVVDLQLTSARGTLHVTRRADRSLAVTGTWDGSPFSGEE